MVDQLEQRVHSVKGVTMVRHRLTDEQWEMIADLFPAPKPTGRPSRDRRMIFDGILWILRTGSPWRDLPEELGSWSTIWNTFDRWNADGTLESVLNCLRSAKVDLGEMDGQLWCIDGTIVRAARCASGGGKKGIRRNRKTTPLVVPVVV